MSVIAHDEQDAVVTDLGEGHPNLIKRMGATQSVWILGVLLGHHRLLLGRRRNQVPVRLPTSH